MSNQTSFQMLKQTGFYWVSGFRNEAVSLHVCRCVRTLRKTVWSTWKAWMFLTLTPRGHTHRGAQWQHINNTMWNQEFSWWTNFCGFYKDVIMWNKNYVGAPSSWLYHIVKGKHELSYLAHGVFLLFNRWDTPLPPLAMWSHTFLSVDVHNIVFGDYKTCANVNVVPI